MLDNVPQTADAADLQTVFAELIKKFRAKKSCAMVREVFDRKKHYKVIIKDTGRENRLFEGLNRTENAYKCSIYIENLKNNNDNIDKSLEDYISDMILKRNKAKENKNYEEADRIRNELLEKNIILKDSRDGTTYEIKEVLK